MKNNKREIFVFGSNLAGRHGKGGALFALKHHGAMYGNPVGLQGNSYAIPTKDENLKTLSLDTIRIYIVTFLMYADMHPEFQFNITKVGSGLAGYDWERDIEPMFRNLPSNCRII